MHKPLFTIPFSLFISGALLSSCTIDSYDKGEGEYSLLTGELVEAHVDSDMRVNSVSLDDGTMLTLAEPVSTRWITTADTIYRAILYYNAAGTTTVEAVALNNVAVLRPHAFRTADDSTAVADTTGSTLKTDPLHLESIWMSKNRKYLNMRLRLLTGDLDAGTSKQGIAIHADTISSTATHARLVFYHDQGTAPEYYSTTVYASIPLATVDADTVTLTVNTYDGQQAYTYGIK